MRYENVEFPDGLQLKCKQCGRCCRYIPGDAEDKEISKIEAKGFRNFAEPPELSGIRRFRMKADGSCFFLTSDKLCQIHDVKPKICRLEPFMVRDWDYEANIIYLELRLDLLCPGIIPSREPLSSTTIMAAQEYVREQLETTAKLMNLPTTSEKVLNRTRNHILRGTTQTTPFYVEDLNNCYLTGAFLAQLQ